MSRTHTIQPEAQDQLGEAFRWYEKQAEGLGHRFLAAFEDCLSRICGNPRAYEVVHRDVRRAILDRFPYGVFYQLEGEIVVVLACFHFSRDPAEWQRRV